MAKRTLRPIGALISDYLKWLRPSGRVLFWICAASVVFVLADLPTTYLGCKERDLRFLGLLIQLVGFSLTAWALFWDSAKDGRNEIINWINRFPPLYGRTISASLSAGIEASDRAEARASLRISENAPIETQLKAIREDLSNLFEAHGQLAAETQRVRSEIRTELAVIRSRTEQTATSFDQHLREVRSGRSSFDLLGICIFVVGSILSTASPELANWVLIGSTCQ